MHHHFGMIRRLQQIQSLPEHNRPEIKRRKSNSIFKILFIQYKKQKFTIKRAKQRMTGSCVIIQMMKVEGVRQQPQIDTHTRKACFIKTDDAVGVGR